MSPKPQSLPAAPGCKHFPECGGCQTLDEGYPAQLESKQAELLRIFGAGGGVQAEWPGLRIDPILPSPRAAEYRHKVQLPFGLERRGAALAVTVGCYAAGSHRVVDQEECLVQDPALSRIAWAVRDWANANTIPVYREDSGTGWLRHLLLRKGAGTGEILLGLITNGPGAGPQALLPDLLRRCRQALASVPGGGELVGVVQSLNTGRNNVVLGGEEKLWWGNPRLTEQLGPFRFPVGVSTFFQVNPFQTPRLYDLAAAGIPAGASVLDLYSGIGSIALWAARKSGSVLGIEENPASVAAARQAAAHNGVANARFLAADVAEALTNPERHLERAGLPPDSVSGAQAVIVDPPRKGLEPAVRDALAGLGASRIVYVSCFPATLARDARAWAGKFRLASLSPVDMFPHTRHLECVAVFDAI